MDMKLVFLCVFAACAVSTVYGIDCYECDLVDVDGNEEGDDYCNDGEKTVDKDKTDSCSKSCYKYDYEIHLDNGDDHMDVKVYSRGCADDNEDDECQDIDDASNSEIELFEALWELTFLGYDADLESIEVCYCNDDLCNSAPSAKLVNYMMLPALLLLAFMLKFI